MISCSSKKTLSRRLAYFLYYFLHYATKWLIHFFSLKMVVNTIGGRYFLTQKDWTAERTGASLANCLLSSKNKFLHFDFISAAQPLGSRDAEPFGKEIRMFCEPKVVSLVFQYYSIQIDVCMTCIIQTLSQSLY